jgi:hypothetical protein
MRTPSKWVRRGEYLHDATKPGFSIAGHPFVAELGKDAPAVIEYLKALLALLVALFRQRGGLRRSNRHRDQALERGWR